MADLLPVLSRVKKMKTGMLDLLFRCVLKAKHYTDLLICMGIEHLPLKTPYTIKFELAVNPG